MVLYAVVSSADAADAQGEALEMSEYRVQFLKRLCNDVGLQRMCLQAVVDVRRSKSEDRAIRAAQRRFERLKRTRSWTVYADLCEIVASVPARPIGPSA